MSIQLLASKPSVANKIHSKMWNSALNSLVLKLRVKTYLSVLSLLLVSSISFGQSIFTNPISGTAINANPYSTGQTLNANITSTGIGRGAGVAQSAANNRYNVSGVNSTSLANAITANDYFQFSITPNACYEIDFTSLVYTSQISTGSINLALRSSVDAYGSNIATSTSTTGATFSLAAASLQNINSNIVFRLYAWGASAGATTFSINDFTFNGTVSAYTNMTAGAASSTPTLCINTALTNITHTTTGATGIGAATGLPAGVSPVFASNTITISGTPTATGTFSYSIPLTGGCGTVNATGTITVSPATPAQPSAITGTATQCPALTAQTYSIAAVTNATTYNWTVPTGWTITAGAGTTSITVTTGSAGQNGNISVTAQNSCGTSTARTLAVTVSPATPLQPSLISGTATQCPALTSQTYSIPAVTNATTYNWTVPTGWSITAGAGTTSITVTTGTSGQNGNISVTAQNSCGTSTARTLAVTVSPATPAQPAAITGTAVQCPALTAQTYSIAAVTNATTYNWTVPTGWAITAGAGTTSITVTTGSAGQNGNISVTAQNSCGTSTAQTLAVTVSPATPLQPSLISGTATQCPALTAQTYSIPAVTNATTYNWTVPTGWTITAGAGTTSITVTTGTSGQNGNISVTAQNSCGTSTARTLAVTVSPATPAQPAAQPGTAVN
jgi:hypothetical protein